MEKLGRDILLKILIDVNDVSKMSDQQLKTMKERIEEEENKRKLRYRVESARRQIKEAFIFLKKTPVTNNYDDLNANRDGIVYKGTSFPYLFLVPFSCAEYSGESFYNYIDSYPFIKEIKEPIINEMKTWNEDDYDDFMLLFYSISLIPIHTHIKEYFTTGRKEMFLNFLGKKAF